jgi:hypothetical protein
MLICVGHHYAQINTNDVRKTWALLQTTGGNDERTSCLCGNRNGYQNTELRTQKHIIGQHKKKIKWATRIPPRNRDELKGSRRVKYIICWFSYWPSFNIDDILSLNNSRFGDYLHRIYPNELEIKDTTDTQKSASYPDIYLEIDNGGRLKQNSTTNAMTLLFQLSTSPSSVAIFQHHQRMEFTFHNSYVTLELVPSIVIATKIMRSSS